MTSAPAAALDASRLRLARQRLGWTLTRTAEASGVSLRTVSGLENGSGSDPGIDTVTKLAAALQVPVEFLRREPVDAVQVEAASFRKLSKTSATKRDAALAAAHISLELFALIDRQFEMPKPDVPTFERLTPEQAAELTRRRWELADRPLSNMVHLLESKGVRVLALASAVTEIDAFCFVRDEVPYVFLNTLKSGERQRFDAAHELGHLVLHHEREMTPADAKQRESEANRFAASFLMPRSGLATQSMAGASLERVLASRSYWRVSAMALTHRLHELGLMSDWQYRAMCITLSDLGYRSHEPDGIVPETSMLLRKVLFGSTRVSLTTAARELGVQQQELTQMLRGLVPVSA